MNLVGFRAAGGRASDDRRRYLVADGEQPVQDLRRFAAVHCDPETGVAWSGGGRDGIGDVQADPHPCGADGVVLCSLQPVGRPPRVVATVVGSDGGRRPDCPAAVRCAARWAVERVDARGPHPDAPRQEDRPVMVDTQAGTREARVHPDGSVSVERHSTGEPTSPTRFERGQVDRAFATDVPEPRP